MTTLAKATFAKLGHWMMALRVTSFVLMGLIAQGSLAQTTTTLNFDAIADDVAITNQYQAQGVIFSGANAINAALLGFTAQSGTQVAYAPGGLMTLTFSATNIQKVSAYITGPVNVGIFAYDSANNLVGQSITNSNTTNALLSVTSSGNPIAKVEIHDGGASFAVDTFAFTTAAPSVPACYTAGQNLYNSFGALPNSAFNCSKSAASDRSRILKKIADFEKLRAAKAGQKKLLAAMEDIQKEVKNEVKSSASKSVLQQIDALIKMIKANGC